MSSIAPLSFHVEPKANVLDGLTLYESFSKETLLKLISSRLLKQTFNNKQAGITYPNEKTQLEAYCKLIKKGRVPVKYSRTKSIPYGRSNPARALGLYNIRREVRHTLAAPTMVDIDVANCHPEMLNQICEAEGFPHTKLDAYVKNRQAHFDVCAQAYGCSAEYVKAAFIIFCYGGGFDNWVNKEVDGVRVIDISRCDAGVVRGEKILEIDVMREFRESMSAIHNRVVEDNPHLVAAVRAQKLEKGKQCYNLSGSVCSYMLQEYEVRVLESVYLHCKSQGLIENDQCVLAADGIMLEKRFYDPSLLPKLSDVVRDALGFNLVFTQKAMNQGYGAILDANQVPNAAATDVDPPPLVVIPDGTGWGVPNDVAFSRLVGDFEKHHTKIVDKSVFVKTTSGGDIVIMTENQLRVANKHVRCGVTCNGHPVSFIDKWLTWNDDINRKDTMEVYPNAALCPSYAFNLWRPFAMELETAPYTPHDDGLATMLYHIKTLCGHEELAYNYFIGWIAMMVQLPEVKTTCVTFISNQGSGKGTLMNLFAKMLGEQKYFETSTPSRDVWGSFNSLMTDAFLVNLNEMEMKEIVGAESQFKALVTDPRITINCKGVAQFKIHSHHHFIITTNKPNPIKTEKGDRRNLIMRSSDEFKGDRVYFDKMYALLEDKDLVRTCYDYFKTYDLSGYRHQDIPETEYQSNLKACSINPVDQWLEQFTRDNYNKVSVELLGMDIYTQFSAWCMENNTRYDTTPIKLGMHLTNMRIDGIDKGTHSRAGKTKVFVIAKLKDRYQLNGL